jgi:hypothetical protein
MASLLEPGLQFGDPASMFQNDVIGPLPSIRAERPRPRRLRLGDGDQPRLKSTSASAAASLPGERPRLQIMQLWEVSGGEIGGATA